ncbi:MAG: hypothetical protein EHM61_23440 [Acidobacteria bacterium]|nr:MAG: hypothetical protein EHM61_23440 [Acidobacteriota bacterium]
MALDQPKEGIAYFQIHYKEKDPEIALYVLLRLIEQEQRWDLWISTYDQAVKERGIKPREALGRSRSEVQEKLIGRTTARDTH